MRPHRYSVLRYGYLAVSLLGWVLFGVFVRANIDQIISGNAEPVGIAATAIYGLILLVGTPIGYAVIVADSPQQFRSSQRG